MPEREKWHDDFIAYTKKIAKNPVYDKMPDLYTQGGKVQWEAPSNRKSGRFKHTHRKRLDWWRQKAQSVGVDMSSGTWISDTAKKIHPIGEKPCRRCGQFMRLDYSYPNKLMGNRVSKRFEEYEYDPLEEIGDLTQRLYDFHGDELIDQLPSLLETGSIAPPDLPDDIDEWLSWIETDYIPQEPSMLSPGAMSNAPDRLDGFHHFNRCCRGEADTGRHKENMRTYTTDRRVFEHWSGGDWIAADRLYGKVRARFRDEPCADGSEGPCSVDHIGPISLGFMHRPEFQLLSNSANSAKGNRMRLTDVKHLRQAEQRGEKVASWYAQPIWDSRKKDVDADGVVGNEKALRLSKLMRDNHQNAMNLLGRVFEAGRYTFLATYLKLHLADRKVEFTNLHIENYLTRYDTLDVKKRTTKYAAEQKARRLRVGFDSLEEYGEKENRQAFLVNAAEVDYHLLDALDALESSPAWVDELDDDLHALLRPKKARAPESALREISGRIPKRGPSNFDTARNELSMAMEAVAEELSSMWEHDRYVRAEFDLSDEAF